MKIIKHIRILHQIQPVKISHAVYVIAPCQNPSFKVNFADCLDGTFIKFIPLIPGSVRYLIKQLKQKCYLAISFKVLRHISPKETKITAQVFLHHKRCGHVHLTGNMTCYVVQIYDHIQAIFSTPFHAPVQICKRIFPQYLLFPVKKQIPVNRDPHMVKPPSRNLSNILFRNECLKMLL